MEWANLIFTGGLECNHCTTAACLDLFSDIDFSAYCSLRQFNLHSPRGNRLTLHCDLQVILLYNSIQVQFGGLQFDN